MPMSIEPTPRSDGTDFTMTGPSAWITVGNISLHITHSHGTVSVEAYEVGLEFDSELIDSIKTIAL